GPLFDSVRSVRLVFGGELPKLSPGPPGFAALLQPLGRRKEFVPGREPRIPSRAFHEGLRKQPLSSSGVFPKPPPALREEIERLWRARRGWKRSHIFA